MDKDLRLKMKLDVMSKNTERIAEDDPEYTEQMWAEFWEKEAEGYLWNY